MFPLLPSASTSISGKLTAYFQNVAIPETSNKRDATNHLVQHPLLPLLNFFQKLKIFLLVPVNFCLLFRLQMFKLPIPVPFCLQHCPIQCKLSLFLQLPLQLFMLLPLPLDLPFNLLIILFHPLIQATSSFHQLRFPIFPKPYYSFVLHPSTPIY